MTNIHDTEEQRLTRVKETLMRRLNEYDFNNDGTLNDLEYEEYDEYEEKPALIDHVEENQELDREITEQPTETRPNTPTPEEDGENIEEEIKEDEKRVDDLFSYKYFYENEEELKEYLEDSEDEAEDEDMINMDIKRLPKQNVKINRNEIKQMKEEKKKSKELIKEILTEINGVLDDFKFNINLVLQNATIEKRKGKLTENSKNNIVDYHNDERANAEEDISFLIEELPEDVDLTDSQYDKIDKVLEKVLNKVSKIVE